MKLVSEVISGHNIQQKNVFWFGIQARHAKFELGKHLPERKKTSHYYRYVSWISFYMTSSLNKAFWLCLKIRERNLSHHRIQNFIVSIKLGSTIREKDCVIIIILLPKSLWKCRIPHIQRFGKRRRRRRGDKDQKGKQSCCHWALDVKK